MFSRMSISKSTKDYSQQIEKQAILMDKDIGQALQDLLK